MECLVVTIVWKRVGSAYGDEGKEVCDSLQV